MTSPGLGQLLADAAQAAERGAPGIDPVAALARTRRRRERRRGHVAILAFVLFMLGLQGLPSDALGSMPTPGPATAAGVQTAPAGQARAAQAAWLSRPEAV